MGRALKITRKLNYDEYIEKMRKQSLHLHVASDAHRGKPLRLGKVRDPEENVVLFLLDYNRWQKALASGEIEKLGPRRYRMK